MPSQPFDRSSALQNLENSEFDMVVVGGGITGAGVALDAASRGLRVALLERDDFASGTSSKSSKLIHGGLRYLQQGDVRLVYQALRERKRLRRNAPHLVHVLPFMIPILTKDGVVSRKIARALGSAMWMYDLTGGWRIVAYIVVSRPTKHSHICPQCRDRNLHLRICITTPKQTMLDWLSLYCEQLQITVPLSLTAAK